jgi:hypothetical protein
MSYFPSKGLGYTQPSPHPKPETPAYLFKMGWSFRRERRTTRSLTSGGDESQEITMLTSTFPRTATALKFESLNWVATDPMPRDQAKSHQVHVPEHRINTIDPMTGNDIQDVTSHPSVEDGDLTVYFETEATRKSYVDLPIDHPNLHLPYPPADDDDRGG